jgi:hypothetical protein
VVSQRIAADMGYLTFRRILNNFRILLQYG